MSESAPSRNGPGPLRSFVGVAGEGQTYRNLCYLLLAIPIGIGYQFGLTLGFLGGLVFSVVLVGIPILLVTIVGARYLAELERLLANWLLTTDIRRPAERPTIADDGLVATLQGLVLSESTWKGIGFLVLKSFLAVVVLFFLIIAGFASLVLLLAPLSESATVFGWEIETLAESLLAVPMGVVLALVTLHVLNGIAGITETLAVALLGDRAQAQPPSNETEQTREM